MPLLRSAPTKASTPARSRSISMALNSPYSACSMETSTTMPPRSTTVSSSSRRAASPRCLAATTRLTPSPCWLAGNR